MLAWAAAGVVVAVAIDRLERTRHGTFPVVPGSRLTSGYLIRRSESHLHRGVDIHAPLGTPVRSLAEGVVVGVWPDCERQGYGNNVLVQHADALSFYAHLDSFAVAKGQYVQAGQRVGTVGRTGCRLDRPNRMNPHLHLEVHTSRRDDRRGRPMISENIPERVDPLDYMASQGVTVG